MKFFGFFFPKIIDKVKSPINGEIEVIEQFGRKSIRVGGMEQSGAMVEKIWEKGINDITIFRYYDIKNCLVLGLGGGSAVKALNQFYPRAKILGVEIDPIMVRLGKKYLGEYKNLQIKIADAFSFISHTPEYGKKFDLILLDVYIGREIPKKLESEEFLRNVKKRLTGDGIVIFNRLRGRGREKELNLFFKKLEKIFAAVKVIKPLINQLFICS